MKEQSNPTDARRIAADVLLRVQQGAYADISLDTTFQRYPLLDPRDRALATELVYGVLRQQNRLDFALNRLCSQPFAKVETILKIVLRLGAYQILQLQRIPESAAVTTSVELVRSFGKERATGFVNGMLRSLIRQKESLPWPDAKREPLRHLVDTLSLPEWLARRWYAEFGATEAALLAAAMGEAAPLTLRVNTLKIGRDAFLSELTAAGHRGEACTYSPDGLILRERAPGPLPGLADGKAQPQDEASQLVARLLAPQPGEVILDACSAPGGKTTHIAALTNNQGVITALDLHPQRLRLVEEGAARLGCRNITTLAADLNQPPPLATASFDRILLDAPCSGLGVLRRNPEIRWRRDVDGILTMATQQRQILRNLAPLLRPGGTLLYSVCTRTPEETTMVIDNFLATHPDYLRDDLRPAFPAWAALFDSRGALATLPHRHAGMDAFYAVRLRRRG